MKCGDVRRTIPLFLYGELSLDEEERFESHIDSCPDCRREVAREKIFHRALDASQPEMTPELLDQSRRELRRRLVAALPPGGSRWEKLSGFFHVRWHVPAPMQPVGALALLAMGFFGARYVSPSWNLGATKASLIEPVSSRVRWVEPGPAGQVQITIEETREKTLSGAVEDERIQKLLLEAAKDPANAGLRVESVNLLKSRPESSEVRNALLYALQHDPNAGVRLKALDGLKESAGEPDVRRVLSQALLHDKDAAVRTQVIDLLIGQKEDRMVGLLQELMRTEDNSYIRMRVQKTLHDMNASLGTF